MNIVLKTIVILIIFLQSSCAMSGDKEVTVKAMRTDWDGNAFCMAYFDEMFRPESDSLKKVNTIEQLSVWKSGNSPSKLFNLIEKVRKETPDHKSQLSVDEKYNEINLILLNNFSKDKGYSDKKCGVLTLNLFREHLYNALGGEDSEVVKEILGMGVLDEFTRDKFLLIAFSKRKN